MLTATEVKARTARSMSTRALKTELEAVGIAERCLRLWGVLNESALRRVVWQPRHHAPQGPSGVAKAWTAG
ncbi:hypothetical protein ACFT8P_21310 [Streptomyces sp. NPDC057101]|uniref:hypothetical protein n=1 Tax=Streptomyces sp. NPDC057101 TaxID=3346020 RepID=UPI003624CF88